MNKDVKRFRNEKGEMIIVQKNSNDEFEMVTITKEGFRYNKVDAKIIMMRIFSDSWKEIRTRKRK